MDTALDKATAGRDTKTGQFLPGHKHHKPTRRKRIPATILRDACSDEELQELIQMGLEKAKAGDDQWITELDSFRERHPDYPIPDELAEQVP